jgi:hypothetical protein
VQRVVERGCLRWCGSVLLVCLSEGLINWILAHLHLAAAAAFLHGIDFSAQTIDLTCGVPMAHNYRTSAHEEALEGCEEMKEMTPGV